MKQNSKYRLKGRKIRKIFLKIRERKKRKSVCSTIFVDYNLSRRRVLRLLRLALFAATGEEDSLFWVYAYVCSLFRSCRNSYGRHRVLHGQKPANTVIYKRVVARKIRLTRRFSLFRLLNK